ncbi:MAG: ABC transporter ATP-binding protein [Myxococcota bacterium]
MRIELRGLKKRFQTLQALKGLDLTIASGRHQALVGPNGSGKSTLIRAILGLIQCEGQVLLDGRSPYESRVELAQSIAYVPQVAPQLMASVQEIVDMVALTRGLDQERISSVAARFDLSLSALAAKSFRSLSGGMKQKLLLSIAFASPAKLFVLDEPTASLDLRAREAFYAVFQELPAGVTTLLCSHRLEELASLAEEVVALEEGAIAYSGPAADYGQARRSA